MGTKDTQLWHIFGHSTQGLTHQRAGKPNQDAMGWSCAEHGDMYASEPLTAIPPVVVSVADGHGSARYPRSQRGAELAVASAIQLLNEMVESTRDAAVSPAFIKQTAEERLPKALVQRWQEAIKRDLQEDPGTGVTDEDFRLYGTTLLAMALTEDFILFVQIGDGDFRIVTDGGEVHLPFAQDTTLLGNETYSLSQKDAWKYIQVHFQMLGERPPALIMLSTDGYSNSFASETDFDQVGSDLLAILRQEGVAAIEARLPEWLVQASAAGSGDDVTVVLVCRDAGSLAGVSEVETVAGDRVETVQTSGERAAVVHNDANPALPMVSVNAVPTGSDRREKTDTSGTTEPQGATEPQQGNEHEHTAERK